MLERDRFIGRIEMKSDKKSHNLIVCGFWLEPGVRLTKRRTKMIESELHRWRTLLELFQIKSTVKEFRL